MEAAGIFLDFGAALNAIDYWHRATPLGVAAQAGRPEMVAFLLDRGADPNLPGAPWATPLAWAITKEHHDVADLFRGRGASEEA